jgi:hypothetical protein
MILLFIVVLLGGTSDGDGWVGGKYGRTSKQFTSITACERERERIIGIANSDKDGDTVLISRCAAAEDLITYHLFRNRVAATKKEAF